MIAGVPAGRELKAGGAGSADGSVIVAIATDAPMDHRNLRRMAARSMLGQARTGSSGSHGSGDYAIAFSMATQVGICLGAMVREIKLRANDEMSRLLLAVIDATEEAVDNSLLRARTMTGSGRTIEVLPVDRTIEILRRHGRLKPSPDERQ